MQAQQCEDVNTGSDSCFGRQRHGPTVLWSGVPNSALIDYSQPCTRILTRGTPMNTMIRLLDNEPLHSTLLHHLAVTGTLSCMAVLRSMEHLIRMARPLSAWMACRSSPRFENKQHSTKPDDLLVSILHVSKPLNSSMP
eukprot:6183950-Amphidinium_carterae.2